MFGFSILNLVASVLPALVPWLSFGLYRAVDHSLSISRSSWDNYYDYIIVGGGSAGCTIANRLSENPAIKVLLLEAGGSENVVSEIPQSIFFLQETVMDWKFRTVPQKSCCSNIMGQSIKLAAGKVLGGSSSINNMFYVRGNRHDFDTWAAMGADGWSYNEILPYFIKSEDNRELDLAYNGFHGRGGPLTIQRSKFRSPLVRSFLEAGQMLGYPITDYNGASQIGFSIPQVTMRRSSRCSAAKAFLRPIRNRPNIHVVTFSYVTKILFNEFNEAIGVMFDRFKQKNIKVYANREVIISAGAIKSPQLLMLSGIGPRKHLQSLGIPVISDLPVGQNLMDHAYPLGMNFLLDESLKGFGEFWTHIVSQVQQPHNIIMHLTLGRGPIASNVGMDGVAFVRTKFANKTILYQPDIQIIFISSCLSSDATEKTRQVLGVSDLAWHKIYKPILEKECFTMLPILLQPKSSGYIMLKSTNPYDQPIIDPRYLSNKEDLETLTEGLRLIHSIGTSKPFVLNYNAKISNLVVPGCEQYKLYSRKYLKCMAKSLTISLWHPGGTCKMGQKYDPNTVVDPELKVKGVKRLRVADASIMPILSSGNTNAAVIMIGEKAADLIKGIYKTPNIALKTFLNYYSSYPIL